MFYFNVGNLNEGKIMAIRFRNRQMQKKYRDVLNNKELSVVVTLKSPGGEWNAMNNIANLLNVKLETLFDLDITSIKFLGRVFLKIYKNSNSKFVRNALTYIFPRFVKFPTNKIIIFSTSGNLVPKGSNIIPYIHTPMRLFSDYYEEYKTLLKRRNILIFIAWPLVKIIYNQWYKNTLVHMKVRFVNSEAVRDRMMRYYSLPSIVLYPFIEFNTFRNVSYSRYFLSVSRFERAKNFNFLIKAFETFQKQKEYSLVIAGLVIGPDQKGYYNELKEYIEKRKLNVRLIANPNENEIKKFYSNTFCFLFSAIREDFGLVLLEAMSSEKPVISINSGGSAEILNNGVNGFLVNNEYEMADKMNYLASNEQEARMMGLNGRKTVMERFSAAKFREKLYNSIEIKGLNEKI